MTVPTIPAEHTFPAVRQLSLLRSFSWLAFLSILVFSLVLAYLVTSFVERRMLERDAALTRDFVETIAKAEDFTNYFRNHQRGLADPGKEEFFLHIAQMPNVIRANVYDAQKIVLWSTDPTLRGRQFKDNDELDEALRGELVVEAGKDEDKPHPKTEHEHLGAATPFVENYIPIRAQDDRQIIGVVEFYREPGALFATIAEGQRLIWTATLAGGLLLYAVLFWTVRRGDRTMRLQQQRILETETMATLGQLASMVAHNVRNPIASIRSTAELAQTFGTLEKSAAADIVADVDRIEHSLRQVLAYATPSTANAARSCANELLRATASNLVPRKNVKIELSLQEPLPLVRVDPVLLGQALKSIVTNAMDAMPAGGKLYLRTCTIAQGKVEVCIADTGQGIPRDALSRVFDAFFTTKPKGMGLGLSLARSIVRRYDGEIDIQSEPTQGTSVFLRLHSN